MRVIYFLLLLGTLDCGGTPETTADVSEDASEDATEDSSEEPTGESDGEPTDDSSNPEYSGPTIPLILTLHMEPSGSRICDEDLPEVKCATDEEFARNSQKMDELIDRFNQYDFKGTFEASPQWLTRLSETAEGKEIMKKVIEGGHEWALHHHGFDHNDWDGFSDNPSAATEAHHNYVNLEPQAMSAYMDIVHAFETEQNLEFVTIEGTDFDYDWHEEWKFKTTDATGGDPLNDPDGLCPTANSAAWNHISLPSIPYEDSSLNAWGVTHTNFMGFTPECQQLKSDHILAYLAGVDPPSMSTTDAVNLVFHVEDYADSDEIQAEFDSFFEKAADYSFVQGMTVQDYMCERVGECKE